MKDVILKNPLTPLERLNFVSLIGHDCLKTFGDVERNLQDPEKAYPPLRHLRSINKSIALLTRDELGISSIDYDTEVSPDSMCRDLEELFPRKLAASASRHDCFKSQSDIIATLAANLINNGLAAQPRNKGQVKMDIRWDYPFPEHALFVPEGARDYESFIRISFHNGGASFPDDVPIAERLQRRIKRAREPGESFGLYFTGLTARVLRMPVHIESQPGDTTVFLYHPVYS